MATTEITLEVERTIKTAEFEGLRVRSSVKETIEWNNEKDREQATSKVIEHLKKDFIKSYNTMVETVAVKRSLGSGMLTKSGSPVAKANVTNDKDELDIFCD